jgi:hypothetical protein
MYEVIINDKLNHVAKDQVDAIWNLGAKFGGVEYNRMYSQNKIQFEENCVKVYTG